MLIQNYVEFGQVVYKTAEESAYAVETAREENLTLTQLLILMYRGNRRSHRVGHNVCIQGTVYLKKKDWHAGKAIVTVVRILMPLCS